MLQGQDLASGNLTAPVLFALQSNCGDELLDLIDSEFLEEGDLQQAIELVRAGGGVAAAKRLACEEADKVRRLLLFLDTCRVLFCRGFLRTLCVHSCMHKGGSRLVLCHQH